MMRESLGKTKTLDIPGKLVLFKSSLQANRLQEVQVHLGVGCSWTATAMCLQEARSRKEMHMQH